MGGRGAFNPNYGRTGGIPLDQRIYSCIGYLEHIKIIQCDKISNNPTTTFSNTANSTYYSYSKENRRIEHIYYFKNHKLVKSVDFMKEQGPMHTIGIMEFLGAEGMTSTTLMNLVRGTLVY